MREQQDAQHVATRNLAERLFRTADVGRVLQEYDGVIRDEIPIEQYLEAELAARGQKKADVIRDSGIERTFAYQIFRGIRHPSRDKVIQLAFGFGMDGAQAQKLLKAARMAELYSKIRRDAVLLYCLDHHLNYAQAQNKLAELSLPCLGREA